MIIKATLEQKYGNKERKGDTNTDKRGYNDQIAKVCQSFKQREREREDSRKEASFERAIQRKTILRKPKFKTDTLNTELCRRETRRTSE